MMAIAGMLASHVGARATAVISGSSLKLALGVLMISVAPLLPMRDRLDKFLFRGEDEGASGEKVSVSPRESNGQDVSVDDEPKSSSSSSAVRDVKGVVLPETKEGLRAGGGKDLNWVEKLPRMLAIGIGSGFLAGVFGVGGGVVTVPAISLATDLGHKEVWSRGHIFARSLTNGFSRECSLTPIRYKSNIMGSFSPLRLGFPFTSSWSVPFVHPV